MSTNLERIDILVVGLIRDNERELNQTLVQLCKFLNGFTFDIYIVESDSHKVPEIKINRGKYGLNELKLISLGDLSIKYPNRIERLTFCRNEYLSYFKNNMQKYLFLVVVDFDGIVNNLNNFNLQTILKQLKESKVDWSAIFPNQIPYYYDVYALRCTNWVNDNVWGLVKNSENSDSRLNKWLNIYSKMYMLPTYLGNIEVQSAFGGIGIYKTNSIKMESVYGFSQVDNFDVCEHVGFNLGIVGKKYIVTNWISSVGKNEHVISRWNSSLRTTFTALRIWLIFRLRRVLILVLC